MQEEVWVAGLDYSEAEADPLRDCAPKIVGDMNRDSWEDIRRFCSSYAGMEEEVRGAPGCDEVGWRLADGTVWCYNLYNLYRWRRLA